MYRVEEEKINLFAYIQFMYICEFPLSFLPHQVCYILISYISYEIRITHLMALISLPYGKEIKVFEFLCVCIRIQKVTVRS